MSDEKLKVLLAEVELQLAEGRARLESCRQNLEEGVFQAAILLAHTDLEFNDEIDEDQINEFDLYNEKDYRTGILHEFDQDNLLTLEREKDEESGEIVEIKAKTVGEDGKLVRIVLITRLGWITMFLSTNWFNTINDASDKSTAFIFVGSLSTKYKNLTTGEYDKVKDMDDEYAEFNNYTFNLWQLVQLIKTKDGSAELIMIEKQESEV